MHGAPFAQGDAAGAPPAATPRTPPSANPHPPASVGAASAATLPPPIRLTPARPAAPEACVHAPNAALMRRVQPFATRPVPGRPGWREANPCGSARPAVFPPRKPPSLARKAKSPGRKAPHPCAQAPDPCAQSKTPCAQPEWPCAQATEPCAQGRLAGTRAPAAPPARHPCLARKPKRLARNRKRLARKAFRVAARARRLAARARAHVAARVVTERSWGDSSPPFDFRLSPTVSASRLPRPRMRRHLPHPGRPETHCATRALIDERNWRCGRRT